MRNFFRDIYRNIGIPVVVCEASDEIPVVFANTEATLLLNPSLTAKSIGAQRREKTTLHHLLRFSDRNERKMILDILSETGSLSHRFTMLLSPEDELIPVTLIANTVSQDGKKYFAFYIHLSESAGAKSNSDVLETILNISYRATDIDGAVDAILSRIGEHIDVSRVYIFEDMQNEYTRNTYEWCAPGIEPAIGKLQYLKKDEYSYADIVDSGGIIADDVSVLPERDRVILEPQGIKAVAVLALMHHDMPIGYIGYDDCKNTRRWSHLELSLLKGVSSIISSLIIRRNAEANILRSREILQTISDNIDSPIYVNDVKTHEIKFVNRTLAAQYGLEPEELIGRKCWQVLRLGMEGPCPFCPVERLSEEGVDVLEWEHQDAITGGWFWLKDSIIKWVDGNEAHFEVAIDITMRKRYEEQLRRYASTDALTGVYSREWGIKALESEFDAARNDGATVSLCFIDIDGLKKANDSLGHEAGDEMLVGISGAVSDRVRKEGGMVCRWGGDEFLALLKCGRDEAEEIMGGVLEELRARNEENEESPAWSFSYGIADFSSSESVDTAISAADKLMYKNKERKYRQTKK